MAGVKKFLDFFVKIEPDASQPSLSDEELQKILAEEAPDAAPKAPAGKGPARPSAPAPAPATPIPFTRPATGAPATPHASQARPHPAGPAPRVSEVAASAVLQMRSPVVNTAPTGELPDFPTIYKAAKVPAPPHGYDTEKILSMMANPRLAGMAEAIKANSVLMALEVANVPIQDVVTDAVARDRALDDFEAWWAARVAQLEADKRAENQSIEEEMNRYLEAQRERIRANHAAVQQALESFTAWKELKRAEEQKLYQAVAPFVAENPVTLNTGMIAPAHGEAPGRPAGAPSGGNSGGSPGRNT